MTEYQKVQKDIEDINVEINKLLGDPNADRCVIYRKFAELHRLKVKKAELEFGMTPDYD